MIDIILIAMVIINLLLGACQLVSIAKREKRLIKKNLRGVRHYMIKEYGA